MNKPEPTSRWKRSAAVFGTGFPVCLALSAYLALSVVLWWGVWSSHPTSTVTCPCNDPALFVWFLEWPAYAISHGHNPFYSSSIFYPNGINLLSNTGVLSLGVPLAPVTWAFGPVAAFNVASTLGPALSSLSMFWLLSRWTRWAPAAFIGGLVFGFSPFALVNLAVAHLNTEVLVLVPLMVACLDEIFVRQRQRPVVVGSALGILVALQFFLSTEILAIVSICTLAALAMLLGYAMIFQRSDVIVRAPYALRSVVTAAVVSIVLLAYPVWFALDGPAHLSGLVWPMIQPGAGGVDLGDIWSLHFLSASALRLFAGYEGPALPQGEYLGIGVLVVIGVGMLIWWREIALAVRCPRGHRRRTFSRCHQSLLGPVESTGTHSSHPERHSGALLCCDHSVCGDHGRDHRRSFSRSRQQALGPFTAAKDVRGRFLNCCRTRRRGCRYRADGHSHGHERAVHHREHGSPGLVLHGGPPSRG